jgi:hypothetical protein
MLSLANVLLWLHARGSECEFLSVTQLPFVRAVGPVSLSVRMTDDDPTEQRCGTIRALDGHSQYEWVLPEDDLRDVALTIHRLACFWEHEYDLFPYSDDHVHDARVHARLVDNQEYLGQRRET